ncbi:FtsQ-type POTRA domain-containing protein [Herbiconiux sp. SYSU D00978]|uniref:FtsQ-type POTRA domain-containing protein n=1 Tax=Herbiconiux sp. SYSU D00978 TaxID=2812562 RepID=UPI001A97AD29|nr:FtsQ-type POTRA domain-containing protein [Herbiconiux sp. SYSU D00978]
MKRPERLPQPPAPPAPPPTPARGRKAAPAAPRTPAARSDSAPRTPVERDPALRTAAEPRGSAPSGSRSATSTETAARRRSTGASERIAGLVHAARESALSRVEPDADTDQLTLPQGVGSTGPTGAAGSAPLAPDTGRDAPEESPARRSISLPRLRPARRRREGVPDAKRELRAAIRERKRAEREEIRRFTRRARHRALTWGISGGLVLLLVVGTLIAVFSPLLSLRTITVAGTQTIDPAAIEDALADQLGAPLAFVDENEIAEKLSEFPAVASYATRTVPPNELVVTVVERTPLAVVQGGSGFDLVDPAGVVLSTTPERPAGYPLVSVADGTEGDGFRAAAEVVLALPDSIAPQVDTVTATTTDDVALTLSGGAQRVVWGSADDSELKARVLAGLLPQVEGGASVEIDVSAPMAPFWRPL